MNYLSNISALLFVLVLSYPFSAFSQEDTSAVDDGVKRIQIIHADMIDYDEKQLGRDIKRLQGSVEFEHDSVRMKCDSAYFNSESNFIQAFSSIHINQGDTIHLYGDSLVYDGNTKIAQVRKNVRLLHDNSILTTDSLNYDRNEEIAHYFDYGKIVDSLNTLESKYGYYYTQTKDYIAVDSVILINPDYKMYSDTLKYNIDSEISFFFGPTEIISDSNMIYCENGWYDTRNDVSQYNQNAYYKNNTQRLQGDSLFYDRANGVGKAFVNVEIIDTTEDVTILGNYAIYYERPERSFMTDSAVFMQVSEEKDTLFLHADTLRYFTITDTMNIRRKISVNDSLVYDSAVFVTDTFLLEKDTSYYRIDSSFIDSGYVDNVFMDSLWVYDSLLVIPTDSFRIKYDSIYTYKLLKAYYRVITYRSDIQAKCDSMLYNMRDSVIQMYHEPVIWSERNQLTASYIELHTKNNKPDYIVMNDAAFIISKEDTLRFNQIKGRDMVGFFKDDSLYKVNVNGNGQSVYYAKETDEKEQVEKLIGVNKAESSDMVIFLENNEPSKILFLKSPTGSMNPIGHLPESELKLGGFIWLEILRPMSKEDIFNWTGKTKAINELIDSSISNSEKNDLMEEEMDEHVNELKE